MVPHTDHRRRSFGWSSSLSEAMSSSDSQLSATPPLLGDAATSIDRTSRDETSPPEPIAVYRPPFGPCPKRRCSRLFARDARALTRFDTRLMYLKRATCSKLVSTGPASRAPSDSRKATVACPSVIAAASRLAACLNQLTTARIAVSAASQADDPSETERHGDRHGPSGWPCP